MPSEFLPALEWFTLVWLKRKGGGLSDGFQRALSRVKVTVNSYDTVCHFPLSDIKSRGETPPKRALHQRNWIFRSALFRLHADPISCTRCNTRKQMFAVSPAENETSTWKSGVFISFIGFVLGERQTAVAA